MTPTLLLLATLHADPLYASSVVGTDFDVITADDPSAFESLRFVERGRAEMPDKRDGEGGLFGEAFTFEAAFSDGTRVRLYVDAAFETREAAEAEAARYTGPLGRLPNVLRRGVDRVVVHRGGPDTTAFSDEGLIVVYSGNATKRIATHDLEETIFHEAVHAAWDATHAGSDGWKRAQMSDATFLTKYARSKPAREDLAESALFAFALTRHPDRIPEPHRTRVAAAIPARIEYVAGLLEAGEGE